MQKCSKRIKITLHGISREYIISYDNNNFDCYEVDGIYLKKITDDKVIRQIRLQFEKSFGKNFDYISYKSSQKIEKVNSNLLIDTSKKVVSIESRTADKFQEKKNKARGIMKRFVSLLSAGALVSTLFFSFFGCSQAVVDFEDPNLSDSYYEQLYNDYIYSDSEQLYDNHISSDSEQLVDSTIVKNLFLDFLNKYPDIDLNEDAYKRISELKVSILDPEFVGNDSVLAYYLPDSNIIFLSENTYNNIVENRSIEDEITLHELIHALGGVEGEYPYYSYEGSTILKNKYSSLNEGITNLLTLELLNQNDTISAYSFQMDCVKVLSSIINEEDNNFVLDAYLKGDISIIIEQLKVKCDLSETEINDVFGNMDLYLMAQYEYSTYGEEAIVDLDEMQELRTDVFVQLAKWYGKYLEKYSITTSQDMIDSTLVLLNDYLVSDYSNFNSLNEVYDFSLIGISVENVELSGDNIKYLLNTYSYQNSK